MVRNAMAEYIERETFLKDIEERYCLPCKEAGRDYNGCKCRACWVDDMRGDVIDVPAADVAPVMRCRDCANFRQNASGVCWCDEYGGAITPNDYCSRAVSDKQPRASIQWEAD